MFIHIYIQKDKCIYIYMGTDASYRYKTYCRQMWNIVVAIGVVIVIAIPIVTTTVML